MDDMNKSKVGLHTVTNMTIHLSAFWQNELTNTWHASAVQKAINRGKSAEPNPTTVPFKVNTVLLYLHCRFPCPPAAPHNADTPFDVHVIHGLLAPRFALLRQLLLHLSGIEASKNHNDKHTRGGEKDSRECNERNAQHTHLCQFISTPSCVAKTDCNRETTLRSAFIEVADPKWSG